MNPTSLNMAQLNTGLFHPYRHGQIIVLPASMKSQLETNIKIKYSASSHLIDFLNSSGNPDYVILLAVMRCLLT
jgi:hypothetical protein